MLKMGCFSVQAKTYLLSREKYCGEKNSKLRLTGMAAGKVTGEKLPMFEIS